MKVCIEVEGDTVSDLADLLCWWRGFEIGLKLSGHNDFIVANNGIESVRKLNIQIKEELKRVYNV